MRNETGSADRFRLYRELASADRVVKRGAAIPTNWQADPPTHRNALAVLGIWAVPTGAMYRVGEGIEEIVPEGVRAGADLRVLESHNRLLVPAERCRFVRFADGVGVEAVLLDTPDDRALLARVERGELGSSIAFRNSQSERTRVDLLGIVRDLRTVTRCELEEVSLTDKPMSPSATVGIVWRRPTAARCQQGPVSWA